MFADTNHEKDHLMSVLRDEGIKVRSWSEINSARVASTSGVGNGKAKKEEKPNGVIVAVKGTEGRA